MRLRVSPSEKDPTRWVAVDIVDVDRQMIFRQTRPSALGPLHQNQRARGDDVVPAEIRELLRRLQPVEIDVKHGRVRCGILLDQRVGGTGDRVADSISETDCLSERGFARAQLACERYEQRRMDRSAEVLTPLTQL